MEILIIIIALACLPMAFSVLLWLLMLPFALLAGAVGVIQKELRESKKA